MNTIITSGNQIFTFDRKYYIIQGNNGNHRGYNREWKINSEGYRLKADANKIYKDMVNENGDIKNGLTPLRICTPAELIEIFESKERITFFNCFDITITEKKAFPHLTGAIANQAQYLISRRLQNKIK